MKKQWSNKANNKKGQPLNHIRNNKKWASTWYDSDELCGKIKKIKANMSGSVDVLVIRQPNGILKSSPFHVRFGKAKCLKTADKLVHFLFVSPENKGDHGKNPPQKVHVYVNGKLTPLEMHISPEGICYFDDHVGVFSGSELSITTKQILSSVPLEKSATPPKKEKKSFFSKIAGIFQKKHEFPPVTQKKPLQPRPETPPLLKTLQFSLCGDSIAIAEGKERDLIFEAHKLQVPEAGLKKYLSDPNLVIKMGGQYYDVKSAEYLLPELLETEDGDDEIDPELLVDPRPELVPLLI